MICGSPRPSTPHAIRIDRTLFILARNYSYEWSMKVEYGDQDSPETVCNRIVIQKGFRWDGASVPKLFWSLGFKPDGPHRAAALVHDFIYIYKGKLPSGAFLARYKGRDWHSQSGSFSRKDADRMFGRMMKESGMGGFRRTLMKWAVSWFGWIYWQDGPDLMKAAILKTLLVLMLAYIFYRSFSLCDLSFLW